MFLFDRKIKHYPRIYDTFCTANSLGFYIKWLFKSGERAIFRNVLLNLRKIINPIK